MNATFFRTPSNEKPRPVATGHSATAAAESLPPARIREFTAGLAGRHVSLLGDLTRAELRRIGYANIREGSELWNSAFDRVVSGLVRGEVDLDELASELAATDVTREN